MKILRPLNPSLIINARGGTQQSPTSFPGDSDAGQNAKNTDLGGFYKIMPGSTSRASDLMSLGWKPGSLSPAPMLPKLF